VCVAGNCEEFYAPPACSGCPCAGCTGDFDTCCPYPGDPSLTTCVEHGACP
jgi:hypothetical protein